MYSIAEWITLHKFNFNCAFLLVSFIINKPLVQRFFLNNMFLHVQIKIYSVVFIIDGVITALCMINILFKQLMCWYFDLLVTAFWIDCVLFKKIVVCYQQFWHFSPVLQKLANKIQFGMQTTSCWQFKKSQSQIWCNMKFLTLKLLDIKFILDFMKIYCQNIKWSQVIMKVWSWCVMYDIMYSVIDLWITVGMLLVSPYSHTSHFLIMSSYHKLHLTFWFNCHLINIGIK